MTRGREEKGREGTGDARKHLDAVKGSLESIETRKIFFPFLHVLASS